MDTQTSATISSIGDRQQQRPTQLGYRYKIEEEVVAVPNPSPPKRLPSAGERLATFDGLSTAEVLKAGHRTVLHEDLSLYSNGDLDYSEDRETFSYKTGTGTGTMKKRGGEWVPQSDQSNLSPGDWLGASPLLGFTGLGFKLEILGPSPIVNLDRDAERGRGSFAKYMSNASDIRLTNEDGLIAIDAKLAVPFMRHISMLLEPDGYQRPLYFEIESGDGGPFGHDRAAIHFIYPDSASPPSQINILREAYNLQTEQYEERTSATLTIVRTPI